MLELPPYKNRKKKKKNRAVKALSQSAEPSQGHDGYLRHEQHLVHARGHLCTESECWMLRHVTLLGSKEQAALVSSRKRWL